MLFHQLIKTVNNILFSIRYYSSPVQYFLQNINIDPTEANDMMVF